MACCCCCYQAMLSQTGPKGNAFSNVEYCCLSQIITARLQFVTWYVPSYGKSKWINEPIVHLIERRDCKRGFSSRRVPFLEVHVYKKSTTMEVLVLAVVAGGYCCCCGWCWRWANLEGRWKTRKKKRNSKSLVVHFKKKNHHSKSGPYGGLVGLWGMRHGWP